MPARRTAVVLCVTQLAISLYAQPPKPIRRPPNNQLALEGPDVPLSRADAPAAISGATSQLVFHTSPLLSKGLLSKQTEEALKALDKANGNATFLKLRAFVAGNGDLRRVHSIVADYFTEKKVPVPVVTTIQVGAFTQAGAQVVIESVSEEKRPINTNGLAFFPGQEAESGAAAVATLHAAMSSASSAALRITCFADSLAEAEAANVAIANFLPKAASVSMQTTRYSLGSRVACEGVGQGGPIRSPKLVLTGTQLVFGEDLKGLQLALDRIDRTIESFGVHYSQAAQWDLYTLKRDVTDQARTLLGTTPHIQVLVEGLTSTDATLAIEATIPAN